MRHLVEYKADGCYLITSDDVTLVFLIRSSWNWMKCCLWEMLTAAVYYINMKTPVMNTPFEHKLTNNITIYDDQTTTLQIEAVINDCSQLWQDHSNVVDVPESEWMKISLLDNWKKNYKPEQVKVYLIEQQDCEIIDKAFNTLQEQNRLEWTTSVTSFTYSCFVVWKTLSDNTQKGCVVIDIWALNKVTMSDAYSVLMQADILAVVQGFKYIFTVDCSSFFYQWCVKSRHCYCLTVASHWGQKMFKVAVMSYWNSSAYVQWMIDRILQKQHDYAKAYVDDIVVFSTTLTEHISHLWNVFQTLVAKKICLLPQKSFLGYSSVHLLEQHVDTLSLVTAEAKLITIKNLFFSQTLTQLKCYLDLTGYLHQYIPHYAAILKPLQQCKMSLNHSIRQKKSIWNNAHKHAADRTGVIEATSQKLNTFHQLQTLFAQPTILIYFVLKQQLYIDIDAFKKFSFDTHIYHFKKVTTGISKQKSMKSILFLSRLLTDAETRYWPTELKIADLVWVVKKVHHMIEAAEFITIIYTDHFTTVTITCQTSLITTSIKKLNLWLIQASEYLQQFCLNIHYKPERTNTISNTLFRLASCDYLSETDESSLDALHAAAVPTYFNTLIELSFAFRQRILDGYVLKGWWKWINIMIHHNNALNIDMNAASLSYTMVWGLIYYKNIEQGYQLCIPAILYKKVFELAHNFMRHSGYVCMHKWLIDSLYLLNLFKHLHKYIHHCLQCQLMQTPHHCSYKAMQFILTPSRPFHIIIIDFILTLPQSTEGFNIIMSVTDKFSKAVTFISEWKIMTAEDWAISLMNWLALLNWGLSKAILFDWDCKFTAALWKELFKQLNVNLLFLTAYHSQTDSSFKVINQVAEIALHHWLITLKLIQNWPTVLSQLQAALNNSTKYSLILLTLNQVLFSFCTRKPLNFLQVEKPDVVETSFDKHENMIDPVDSLANHINSKVTFNKNVNVTTQQPKCVKLTATYQYKPAYIDAKNAIAFVFMQMKHYYDKTHMSRYFWVNDMVNLHLHQGYSLLSIENKKLNQQFVDTMRYWMNWQISLSPQYISLMENPQHCFYCTSWTSHISWRRLLLLLTVWLFWCCYHEF